MKRRDFIQRSVLGSVVLPSVLKSKTPNEEHVHTLNAPSKFEISIFSKNLQWLDYDGMAETAAELGFDGIDLTVRPNGHVLPDRVTDDLPRAYEAIKKHDLKLNSIVTAIDDANEATTGPILEAASNLNIPLYRLGWFHYDSKKSIDDNLLMTQNKLRNLDDLSKRYRIKGVYQNHSGEYFGAAIWDFAQSLKEVKSMAIGSQYDLYHAMVEGANSWIYGFQLLQQYIWMINIKDFQWTNKTGRWTTETVPLGEGAIDWKKYFTLLRETKIVCPVSLHFEYPIGGAEHGGTALTIERKEVLAAMKRDLSMLRNMMTESGLLK